jgi:hypothetical protein
MTVTAHVAHYVHHTALLNDHSIPDKSAVFS